MWKHTFQKARSNPHAVDTKNRKTLLEFAKPGTTFSDNDSSIKQVIDAVAKLSLKVDSIGKQHTTFLQLAFEDKRCSKISVRKSVFAMRRAENILELIESPRGLNGLWQSHWMCCLTMFTLFLRYCSQAHTYQAYTTERPVNPKSNGTLSSGLFVNKESSRLLIKGIIKRGIAKNVSVSTTCVWLEVDCWPTRKQWWNSIRNCDEMRE